MNNNLISELENSVLDLLPIGIGIGTLDGGSLYLNDALLRLGGYSREDINESLKNIEYLYYDPAERENVLQIAKAQGYLHEREVKFKRKDGSVYEALLSLNMIRYKNTPSWLAVVQDVATKKTLSLTNQEQLDDLKNSKLAMLNLLEDLDAEKDLLERERKKDEAVLFGIGDGVVVTDQLGRITFVNRAFEALLGWKYDEAVGKQMVEVIPKFDEKNELIAPSERSVTKVLSGEVKKGSISTVDRSHYYKRKNGTKMPILGVVTPIIVNNIIVGAVQVFRDITHEKEIDQIKDDFVSVASHELRTPLTAIDGLVSMILDGEYGEVSGNLEQPLRDISTSSDRLIRLVNDLLNLSRIQAGRLKYNLTDFLISEPIEKIVRLLGTMFEEKGLYLKVECSTSDKVQADIDKIEQILNNLIGNSFKFTDTGGVIVKVESADSSVKISIVDTGIGMKKEDQNKLFGKFQQLDTGNERPQGTGLGLHISREMVRKMGGELLIAISEPGQGSTFVFTMPKTGSELAINIRTKIESEAKIRSDQKSDTISQ